VQVTIWGCRGSLATPGRDTVRYGGNTSCLEVELANGSVFVLDAGTGIRELGVKLERRKVRRIQLLLTHLHLDHVEGLRFFGPLWDEQVEIDIWGPPSPVVSLRDRIARAFSPPLFPIAIADVPARLNFNDVPREQWILDGATLRGETIVHPGPTVGYRIESGDRTLAYLPDHEPALTGSQGPHSPPAPTYSCTTHSSPRRSTRIGSAGATRAPPTRLRTARPSALTESCSFITIPITTTFGSMRASS
jgi:phosphoribosyl 1,2-cyclic phosphodiesterase